MLEKDGPEATAAIVAAVRQAELLTSRRIDFSRAIYNALANLAMMEGELHEHGVDVRFNFENPSNCPFTERDFKIAEEEREILVPRPCEISLSGSAQPFTFEMAAKIFAPILPFSVRTGSNEELIQKISQTGNNTNVVKIALGWALVREHPLPESTDCTYYQQEQLIASYSKSLRERGASIADVRRRTAIEAYFDSVFFLITQGFLPLGNVADFTSTNIGFNRERVALIPYENEWEPPSITFARYLPEHHSSLLGVYTTR